MISQELLGMYIMKKTLALIKNLSANNIDINRLVILYESGGIDEDTLISNVILTLSAEKLHDDESDDDLKLDIMTW